MNEELSILINTILDISPYVWRILLKQAYVQVVVNAVWAVGLSLLVLIANKYILSNKSILVKEYAWEFINPLRLILSWLLWGIVLLLLTSAIARLINPEYFAIQMILKGL